MDGNIQKKEDNMEDKMRQVCLEYGMALEDLTIEERAMLEEEIKAQEKGLVILDGVFSNPSIMYRKRE